MAARWSAKRWRRARVSTPVEFLEERYSPFFRQLFAWSGFPLRIIDDGLKLYALGVFVSVAAGIDIIWSIVVSAVVLLAYTFFGGLWAVAVTDFVQGIVLYVALLIIFPLAVIRGGGWSHLVHNPPTAGYFHLAAPPYTWAYVLGFFLLILLNYNAGWALVQRFYSVKDDREARKVGLMAAARPPKTKLTFGPGTVAASLDHSIWFHRPYLPTGWHCYHATHLNSVGARGLAIGGLYDEAGALVATMSQEALWRLRGEG